MGTGRVLQENGIDTTIDVGQAPRIKTPFEKGFIPTSVKTTPDIKKGELGTSKGTGSDPAPRLHASKPWRPVQGLENVTVKGSTDVAPQPISQKVGSGAGFNDPTGIKGPKENLSGQIPLGRQR
jgi:hypothetical protein